nr:hypothetical protein [Streptomyces sp. NBRC 110028]
MVRGISGQPDITRRHTEPVGDEREHIDVPRGLATTLQPADGALAVPTQIGQPLLGPPTFTTGGRDGLTRTTAVF